MNTCFQSCSAQKGISPHRCHALIRLLGVGVANESLGGSLKPQSVREEADRQLEMHEHGLQKLVPFYTLRTLNLVIGCIYVQLGRDMLQPGHKHSG